MFNNDNVPTNHSPVTEDASLNDCSGNVCFASGFRTARSGGVAVHTSTSISGYLCCGCSHCRIMWGLALYLENAHQNWFSTWMFWAGYGIGGCWGQLWGLLAHLDLTDSGVI